PGAWPRSPRSPGWHARRRTLRDGGRSGTDRARPRKSAPRPSIGANHDDRRPRMKGKGAETDLEDRSIAKSLVGLAKGRDVHITRAAALVAAPSRDMSIVNGGCGPAIVNGKLAIHNGGCGPVIANGGLSITNGGCGPVIANGDVSIDRGGSQSIISAGSVRLGPKA